MFKFISNETKKKNLTGHIWKTVTFGKNQLVILKTDEVKL